MHSIDPCVIQTVGCGKSYKYTYKNLQCKILQTFYKNVTHHLMHKKSSTEYMEYACRYFVKAA